MTKNKNDLFQVVFYYKGIKTVSENILLSMIENIGGELTASNKYLSQYLGLSVRSTSKLINNLEKRGYINIKLVVNKYRTITLTDTVVKLTKKDFSTEKEEDLNPSNDTTDTTTSKEDNSPVETPKNEDEGKSPIDLVSDELPTKKVEEDVPYSEEEMRRLLSQPENNHISQLLNK